MPHFSSSGFDTMLYFLILCSFLQTLRGASVPPPNASSSAATPNMFGVTACECPVTSDHGAEQLRTDYTILKSCLLTILACTWKSAHPNINDSRDPWWTRIKRKLVAVFCTLLAPEAVFWWALKQNIQARRIAQAYNRAFTYTEETEVSPWAKVMGAFQPLPEATTRRGAGQPLTITHGFFVQMGGFVLYEGEYPKEVLDYKTLVDLIQDGAIDPPTVTERDLQDRSKSDATAKIIFGLQTGWFAFQCAERIWQDLPLSELEVLTLAYVGMNTALFIAWWSKPQGVDMAICVPMKRNRVGITMPLIGEGLHEMTNCAEDPGLSKADSLPRVDRQHSRDDELSFIPHNEQQLYSHTDQNHHKPPHSPSFYFPRLPIRFFVSILRPLFKLGSGGSDFKRGSLRVPMFYVEGLGPNGFLPVLSILGTMIGAIHLIAWTSEFPSPLARQLWRSSAIVLTVAMFLLQTLDLIITKMGVVSYMATLVYVCVYLMYLTARCVVIVIALLSMRHLPHDILRDVSWTSYLPHF
ncbi:hypothetical protein D9619_012474 [Psilocybe cf. subviscida]|uniref:Uncharacterized protein n=1 Tax=Psilocybe cf. subviscida TaxID=2480587 RepID=A0A8H5ER86_9AGAR|nr:hypothetical protein D9619_012474 [Psilocybe cf. subviscida]